MPTQTTAIVTQLIPHRHNEMGLYQTLSARNTSESMDLPVLSKELGALSLQSTSESSQRGRKTRPLYQPPHRRRGKCQEQPPLGTPPAKHRAMTVASRTELAVLISLLNTLVYEYPRQNSFHSLLQWFYCLDKGNFWNRGSCSFRFIRALAKALAANNLTRFEQLTRESSIRNVMTQIMPCEDAEKDSVQIAVISLMNDLRVRVQADAWTILRSAYREADSANSGDWLAKTLMILVPLKDNLDQKAKYVDTWFSNKPMTQVTPKEGVAGRWILHR